MRKIDLVGQRYGKLVVIEEAESASAKSRKVIRRWLCQCDCGNKTIVRHGDLRSGRTLSCGCYNYEPRNIKHGFSKTKLYDVYSNMKQRCNCPTCKAYKYYGARGIKVCEEWQNDVKTFIDWAFANGYKEGLSIDRIDVDGDYCPENCRWTDAETQAVNQGIRKDNKTGHKGIYISHGLYRVQVRRNKKTYYGGPFKELDEAIKERDRLVAKATPKEPTLFGREE